MPITLEHKASRLRELEAEIEGLQPVPRWCLNATAGLSVATTLAWILVPSGGFGGVVRSRLFVAMVSMLLGTGWAVIWAAFRKWRLREDLARVNKLDVVDPPR